MRGDHSHKPSRVVRSRGLPPRARGSRGHRTAIRSGPRPTPACAGITLWWRSRRSWRRAYPRVRGDHLPLLRLPARGPGLPPRARGSPSSRRYCGCRRRPTPACAGITSTCCRASATRWAYPRVRGDHSTGKRRSTTARGLPPRARGSRERAPQRRQGGGPTPACAGITPPSTSMLAARWAYPRVRGDHTRCPETTTRSVGLPPRARGSRPGRLHVHQLPGPTPACAGITAGSAARPPTAGAYPRVRGDHKLEMKKADPHPGLPPRARGSLRLQ